MIRNTLHHFRAMRPSVRGLLFVYWIYAFAAGMVGVFTQIFLYQKFTSVSLNVTAIMMFYTGIMLGFCLLGIAASIWRLNIKWGFMLSFVLLGVALLYLLHIETIIQAYSAMLYWGIGNGAFWLTINTFELSETKDEERDFYSSVLSAGNQVLGLLSPAAATLLIWLSGAVFHFGTYTLLFTVAPAIYLLGFFCFSNIRDYRPPAIEWADIRHYFTDRANQAAQLFTLGTGFQQTLGTTIPSLATLLILGTALRVGIYSTLFALFSIVCVLFVAQYRTQSNRLLIYGITTAILALTVVYFGYSLTLVALIVFTVVEGSVGSLMSVSSHVIDLKAMEIGREETDFYATMILRDFFLWIWRCLGGVAFLILMGFIASERAALSTGLYLWAAGMLLTYCGAVLFMRIHGARGKIL